jgi:TonB family protein
MIRSILLLILLFPVYAFATGIDTAAYLYKNSGKQVDKLDSADYVRIVYSPAAGSNAALWPVKDYYINGKLKQIATAIDSNGLVLEGQAIEYYPNGNKKSVLHFTEGKKFGLSFMYYPNGKLYTQTELKPNKTVALLTCKDSTGKLLVENGNGKWLVYDESFSKVLREGSVVNGYEEGDWQCMIDSGESSVLKYKKGVLTTGIYHNSKGVIYNFNGAEAVAQYKGGTNKFLSLVYKKVNNPNVSRVENAVGRVIVTFVIEKDGSMTDIRCLGRKIGYGLEEIALNAVKSSPPWIPGFKNGVPVRTRFSLPIIFSLDNSMPFNPYSLEYKMHGGLL